MGIDKRKQAKVKEWLQPFYETMEDLEAQGSVKQERPKAWKESKAYKEKGAPYTCFVCRLIYHDKKTPAHICTNKKNLAVSVCDKCFEKLIGDRMARIELGLRLPKKTKKTR